MGCNFREEMHKGFFAIAVYLPFFGPLAHLLPKVRLNIWPEVAPPTGGLIPKSCKLIWLEASHKGDSGQGG